MDVLFHVAELCREIYCAERVRFANEVEGRRTKEYIPSAQWDGGVAADGKTHEPIWPKIARFMLRNKLNPAAAIAIRFRMAAASGLRRPPFPNQIAMDYHLDKYTGAAGQAGITEESLRAVLRSEIACCSMNMTKYQLYHEMTAQEAYRWVLTDEELPISPLLRYCIAEHENITDVADRYLARATTQYICAPDEHDTVWGNLLPLNFCTSARAAMRLKA